MPLSQAADRVALHRRGIVLHGYERRDGLYDIEAHLTDTKTYAFDNIDRGTIEPGEPLHQMWARFTIDEDMRIVAAEASTDNGPYTICPGGAASFASLAGLTIGAGFLRAARERVGGTTGCTHLRELLQQMATVAMQTMYPVRSRRAATDPNAAPTRLINTCHAYASDGDLVRRRWPALYTGDDASHDGVAAT